MIKSITLITDWHNSDYYLGALKGSIINHCDPTPRFVDISHQIGRYQYQEAAFVLRNSYHYFPKGTIHVITVNNRNENPVPYIAAFFDEHYFISPDSGILNLLIQDAPHNVVLMSPTDNYQSTFPELSYISNGICYIHKNGDINGLGTDYSLKKTRYIRPQTEADQIIGNITYIDSFGNIITNITRKIFEEAGKNRKFSILLKGKTQGIEKIHDGYVESVNELIAVFNSAGLLEIAHMNYPANKSLGLRTGDRIKITFK